MIISKKVPNGKLVSANITRNGENITIKIMGDFFLFPEEAIVLLEDELNNLTINSKLEEIKRKIDETIIEHDIKIIGFKSEDLAEVINEGLKLID